MKHFLTTTVLFFMVVGCSPMPHKSETPPNANTGDPTYVTPSSSATTDSAVTDNPATEQPISESKSMAITAGPPMLPILTAVPSEGWQSFTSVNLGVTVDYPSDWSVTEQTDSVIFMSPQGEKIQLQAITTSSNNTDSGTNNQQCATLINSYGLSVNTCVDTSTNTYSAKFSLQSNTSTTQQWRLFTTGKDAMDVYLHMLDSLHPIQ